MPDEPPQDYDVVVIGAGVAGAMVAWKLAEAKLRVVMIEAGEGLDERPRLELVGNYADAVEKTTGSPYKDGVRDKHAPFPEKDTDYFVQEDGAAKFKSTYLRQTGGSTWHFLGNVPRLVPSDFKLRERYQVGLDWPIGYDDLEGWYGEAEKEMGVAGDHAEWNGLLGAHRSGDFPMSKIWQSYSDEIVKAALAGKKFEDMDLRVLSTPQARNSQPYARRRPKRTLSPRRPVLRNPVPRLRADHAAGAVHLVSDPYAAAIAELFDGVYILMLRQLQYVFSAHPDKGDLVRQFAGGAILLMPTVIKPLGEALALLPAGGEHGSQTAGPAFAMTRHVPLPANPRVAAIVVREQLSELAAKAARLAGDPRAPQQLGRAAEKLQQVSS